MRRLLVCAMIPILLTGPAMADDFEESVEAALEAYRAGDIKAAKEEIDFAATLLNQLKAEGLNAFLPPALEGWTREDQQGDQAAAAFGGGQVASARYEKDDKRIEIQFMANNQMVTALGAMFSNPTLMGAAGKVKRINRQKVVVTNDGEIQAMVDGRIMVQITGSGEVEDKEAYFEEIDIKGLKEF
ncbi:MAG: hypothetical protein AAF557_00785 [Pseudomonadota bacterium]